MPAPPIAAICRALHRRYKEADLGNPSDPIDELIYISLTRQTHSQNAHRSWNAIIAAGGAQAIITMPEHHLVGIIKSGGLARQKARWIKQSLSLVIDKMGTLSLAKTAFWSDDDLERFLISLPGVSIKTAKCIMLYGMGRKVLPVDTHLRRIALRMGLITEAHSEKQIHRSLENLVPPELRYSFHVNAVWHGRQVCTARNPDCPVCMVRQHCTFYLATPYPNNKIP